MRGRVALIVLLADGLRSLLRPRKRVDHLDPVHDNTFDVHSQAEDRY